MDLESVIRSETDADVDAIAEVTIAAFKTLEISNQTEQFIIEALRAAKALAVSLVADVGGPRNRAYCVLSRDHFGRHTELVRTWTCLRIAGVSAEGHWQSPDRRRLITTERLECPRMLPRGASRLLQECRVREHFRTCA